MAFFKKIFVLIRSSFSIVPAIWMLLLIKDLFWPSYVRLLVFWIFCLIMAQWKIELERIQGLTFSYYNIFPSLFKNVSNIYQLMLPFFHLTEVLFITSIVGKKWVSDLISKKKETHLLVPVYDSKLRRQNHTDTLTYTGINFDDAWFPSA